MASSEDQEQCPSCGAAVLDDLDPCYLTLYVPKQERIDFVLQTCAPCAVGIRVSAQQGAEKLENRSSSTKPDTGDEAWRALGILPQT